VVFTKGWEPPLLEFADFLALLRDAVGPERTVTVVPIDTRGRTVAAADRDVWASFLGRQPDPKLYVMHADAPRAAVSGDRG
jgi:hypothetical protein